MSVSFTADAVRAQRKTVTRRKGWWTDKRGRRLLLPGDRLTLCEKVMGRKPGEPLIRICEVEVVSVRREPLCAVAGPWRHGPNGTIIWPEMIAEGFPDMGPGEFMRRYFREPQGIRAMDDITRIEWKYLPVVACPRCSDGLPICTDMKPDGTRYTHAETCATYEWADDLCEDWEADYAPPAMERSNDQ